MIKSMTAFGRAEKIFQGTKFALELHSVNRKVLDITLQIPKDLLRFDIEIRQKISSHIQRGAVTLRLSIENLGDYSQAFTHLSQKIKSAKKSWDKLAKDLGCEPVSLPFLVEQLELFFPQELSPEDSVIREALEELMEKGLKEFDERRKKEGRVLAKDIEERLKKIETALKKIETKAPKAVLKHREKLRERIQAIVSECEERLLKEIAIFAEKVDITEELVRLSSHLKQFREELKNGKGVGRTLDFLLQELHRETNTIAAKSADQEVSSLTIQIKGELEKIREQVQNIE